MKQECAGGPVAVGGCASATRPNASALWARQDVGSEPGGLHFVGRDDRRRRSVWRRKRKSRLAVVEVFLAGTQLCQSATVLWSSPTDRGPRLGSRGAGGPALRCRLPISADPLAEHQQFAASAQARCDGALSARFCGCRITGTGILDLRANPTPTERLFS
jgi:hypothetical protein